MKNGPESAGRRTLKAASFVKNIARPSAVFAQNRRQMNAVILGNSFVALRFVITARAIPIPAKDPARGDL